MKKLIAEQRDGTVKDSDERTVEVKEALNDDASDVTKSMECCDVAVAFEESYAVVDDAAAAAVMLFDDLDHDDDDGDE